MFTRQMAAKRASGEARAADARAESADMVGPACCNRNGSINARTRWLHLWGSVLGGRERGRHGGGARFLRRPLRLGVRERDAPGLGGQLLHCTARSAELVHLRHVARAA